LDGHRQGHVAEGWLCSPEGTRIVTQCREHAERVISEYKEKLGETWTFAPDTPSYQDLTEEEQVIADLLYVFTHGGGHGNPYMKPEVKRALTFLAARYNIADWHDATILLPKEGS
jgi:hypothetical protein